MRRFLLLGFSCLTLSAQTSVPFVGCPADGQAGPIEPPEGKPQIIQAEVADAAELAYYSSGRLSVLAPRGWHCLELYGSGGATLFVSPRPFDPPNVYFSPERQALPGPIIAIEQVLGESADRFTFATILARMFPSRTSVARKHLEGFEDFAPPQGPYPADKLSPISETVVRYETPSRTYGIGTDNWLAPGDDPVHGSVIFIPAPASTLRLQVRLPAELRHLSTAIIEAFERENVE